MTFLSPSRQHHYRTVVAVVALALLAAGCAGASTVDERPLSVLVLLPRDSPTDAVDVSALQRGMDAELTDQDGRAGGHPVRLILGSTSDPLLGTEDFGSCPQIARSYAGTSTAVAVIGPLTPSCNAVISAFDAVGVAVVSPTLEYPVFTHVMQQQEDCDVGNASGIDLYGCEPADFYPTGVRNYAHVTATADQEGPAAAWQLAQLGVRRVFVVDPGPWIGAPFVAEARRLGVKVVGSGTAAYDPTSAPPPPSMARLAARIIASGADGVAFLNDDADPAGRDRGVAPILTALRAQGFHGPFIGAFLDPTQALVQLAPNATEGMYYTSVRLPLTAMPAAAQHFAAALGLSGRQGVDAVYGAVAMQVVLDAIADSNATRAGVQAALFGLRINSLIGPLQIDANGDPLPEQVAIFQVEHDTFVYRHTLLIGPTQ